MAQLSEPFASQTQASAIWNSGPTAPGGAPASNVIRIARQDSARNPCSPRPAQRNRASRDRGVQVSRAQVQRGEKVVRGCTGPQDSCFVLKGTASREMVLPRGARQMVGIYIRGDFVDLHAYLLNQLEHDVVALTDVAVAFVPHHDITESILHPNINRLLWRLIAVDAAIQRNWLASMARRQAQYRLAHFLCEQHARIKSQGFADDVSFELPISQATLGDLLGLSAVHMNRSLQALRKTGLVNWQGQHVTLAREQLAEMCGFEPSYLSLKRRTGSDV
ncbi:Crp/Fnr family transcriptional regulator [Bosea beijingensis]|uniref:Crp/Fnr family transcriptional regulator n=1 Tax=Bosea beijingensis TaxID=3068632 RepID=UPI0027416D99|nr:Crp/Fnr family transcriptional regulator [Bosea sp. REN20]